jgi:hypothetical protein
MLRPTHSPRLYYSNNTWRRVWYNKYTEMKWNLWLCFNIAINLSFEKKIQMLVAAPYNFLFFRMSQELGKYVCCSKWLFLLSFNCTADGFPGGSGTAVRHKTQKCTLRGWSNHSSLRHFMRAHMSWHRNNNIVRIFWSERARVREEPEYHSTSRQRNDASRMERIDMQTYVGTAVMFPTNSAVGIWRVLQRSVEKG